MMESAIKITKPNEYGERHITKGGEKIGMIKFVPARLSRVNGGPAEDHYMLRRLSGRVDRFGSLADARNEALKL